MRLEDLPRKYRKQAEEQITKANNAASASSNVESNVSHGTMAKKKVEGLPTPCRIHFHSVRKRLADSDGISGKACLDGIVHAGLLPDDKTEFIPESPIHTQEKTKEDEYTVIEIYEFEEDNTEAESDVSPQKEFKLK